MRWAHYTPDPGESPGEMLFGSATGFSMQISENPLQVGAA